MEALAPFGVTAQAQVPAPLPYLADSASKAFDIRLDVQVTPKDTPVNAAEQTVSRSNAKYLYWSHKQQLVHHSVTGCNMVAGDLLGSGTISGPSPSEYGSMLELSWRGSKEVPVGGGVVRKFLQDGDEVNLLGYAQAPNYRVGFGDCKGRIQPAVKFP